MSDLVSISPHANLPEVCIAGFLRAALGLGETGRLIARALQSQGIPLRSEVYEKADVPQLSHIPPHENTASPPSAHPGLTLLCLNGEHFQAFYRKNGAALFENRYVISTWFWETEELPDAAAQGFRFVDEVWAASAFVESTLRKRSGDVPVHRFVHPLSGLIGDAATARRRFAFEDRFVFLFTFDFNSCLRRKNPAAVCEAFVKAFPEPQNHGPLCVIKSINGATHPVDFSLLRIRGAARPAGRWLRRGGGRGVRGHP